MLDFEMTLPLQTPVTGSTLHTCGLKGGPVVDAKLRSRLIPTPPAADQRFISQIHTNVFGRKDQRCVCANSSRNEVKIERALRAQDFLWTGVK
jgi:hypothetical protein